MKKFMMFAASFLVAGSVCVSIRTNHSERELLRTSLEALADGDELLGHCRKTSNACMTRCPFCNEPLISEPDYAGPAYNINGECPNCHEHIHID